MAHSVTNFSSFYFRFQFFSIKEILLSIIFVLESDMMKHPNNNKRNNTIATAAKVFSLATILVVVAIGVSTMPPLAALATTATRSGTSSSIQNQIHS
jgi:hypothetical protein